MKTILCFCMMMALLDAHLIWAAAGEPPARKPVRIAYSEDDFRNGQAHLAKEVALAPGDQLIIELGSNPSTGFSWGAQATNSNPAALKQVNHQPVGAKAARPGAGGSQVWTFEALKPGDAALNFSYGRPWQGGEKGTWTLKITAKVK